MSDKEMLAKLEEARKTSESYGHVIAISNGEDVDFIFGDCENTAATLQGMKDCGYWVVNNFINGEPVGLGI